MRLIRLISDQPTGSVQLLKSEFENYFKDNIIIKANGKIGLLHASIPVNYKEIHVTSTGNSYEFKTADSQAQARTVNLGEDHVYSVSEFITLFKGKTWKLLEFANRSDIGFLLSLSVKNKSFALNVYRCKEVYLMQDNAFTVNRNVIINADNIVRGAGNDNTAFLFSRLPYLMSCSYSRVKLTTVGSIIMGLTNTVDGASIATLEDLMLVYGVKVAVQGGVTSYFYIDERGMMIQADPTVVAPVIDDTISVEIEKGKINYRVYDGGDNLKSELYSFEIDQTQVMHFCIGLRTAALQVSRPKVFYDPLFQVNTLNQIVKQDTDYDVYNTIDEEELGLSLGAMPTPPMNQNVIYTTINFPQEEFRNILGFEVDQLRYQGLSTMFLAPNQYNALSIPSTLLIELPSVKLNSYDGLIGNRRNILAILPNDVATSERLLYTNQNPVMLDIDNQFDINLRSIRARIVNGDDDGSLLDVFDRIELTLLVD